MHTRAAGSDVSTTSTALAHLLSLLAHSALSPLPARAVSGTVTIAPFLKQPKHNRVSIYRCKDCSWPGIIGHSPSQSINDHRLILGKAMVKDSRVATVCTSWSRTRWERGGRTREDARAGRIYGRLASAIARPRLGQTLHAFTSRL